MPLYPPALASINISAGTTSNNLSAFTFANGSGVSFGLNASTITAAIATSYAGQGLTTTTTAGTAIVGTNNSNGLSLGVPAFLTTARASTDAIGLNTAQTNVTWTVNSGGLSLNAGGYAGTGLTTTTTAGTALVGTNNTVGLSLGVPAFLTTARGSTDAVGLNTAQTNVTWTVNSSGISLNAGGYAGTGFTSTTTAGTVIVGTHNTAGLSIGVPAFLTTAALSNGYAYNGWLEPYPLQTATVLLAAGIGSLHFAPFTAFGSLSGGRFNLLIANTGTANLFQDIGETAYKSSLTGTVRQGVTFSAKIGIFSQGTGSNSTQLENVWSNQHTWDWSKGISISTNAATNIAVSLTHGINYLGDVGSDGASTASVYQNSGSSTFGNSSGNSTGLSTVFSSGRNLMSGSLVLPIPFSTTLTGGIYWVGLAWSSSASSASTGALLSSGPDYGFSGFLGLSRLAIDSAYRNFGSTTSTNRSQFIPYGRYTSPLVALALPSVVALSSDVTTLGSAWVPYFNIQLRGLTK